MKIAMVSEHASPLAAAGGVDAGGQNVHVAALAGTLAARGHRLTVYTRRDDEALPRRVAMRDGVDVVHVDAGPARRIPKDDLLPLMAEFADDLLSCWSADAPDVVHAHFWMSGVASLDAAGRMPQPAPPVVQSFHALGHVKRRFQGADDTSPAQRRELEPSVGRNADLVIATCSDEAFELRGMGVAPSRIAFAPCGVDTALFTPEGESRDRTAAFRVLSVGRLVPRKGVDLLIDALALLRRRGVDDVELVVAGGAHPESTIGTDPDAVRLMAHAQLRGVADRVVFLGQVPHAELPALLRSADTVACTPWYEPFGIVPLEAMSTGVPVIAAAVGGLRDTVVDDVTGIHVPPRDAAAIAAAVEALRREPEWARALGRGGRARAVQRFTWDRVALDTERAYRKALAGRAHAPRTTTAAVGR
jgi:glycosyltransferase involved in cell wall biosynthesis